jgi:hypothetical protein
MKGTFGHDLDRSSQKILKVHKECSKIQKGSILFQVGDKINIAFGGRRITAHGTEQAKTPDTMKAGQFPDPASVCDNQIIHVVSPSDSRIAQPDGDYK